MGRLRHGRRCCRRLRDGALGPAHDLERAVSVFGKRRQALDPVAVVGVQDAVDLADLGVMDVAADDAMHDQ